MKICGKCKLEKEFSSFYKKNDRPKFVGTRSGYSSNCKSCILANQQTERAKSQRADYRSNGGANIARSGELKRCYGIDLDDYNQLVQLQGGGCAVCGRKDSGQERQKAFHVDHNHTTRRIRGVLCSRCNHAIGLFQDNPDICLSAAEYLKRSLPELDLS